MSTAVPNNYKHSKIFTYRHSHAFQCCFIVVHFFFASNISAHVSSVFQNLDTVLVVQPSNYSFYLAIFTSLHSTQTRQILICATISQIRLDITSGYSAYSHDGTVIYIHIVGLKTVGLNRFANNECVKMRRGISFPKSYAFEFSN